jgi:hypothetical protein
MKLFNDIGTKLGRRHIFTVFDKKLPSFTNKLENIVEIGKIRLTFMDIYGIIFIC